MYAPLHALEKFLNRWMRFYTEISGFTRGKIKKHTWILHQSKRNAVSKTRKHRIKSFPVPVAWITATAEENPRKLQEAKN